MRSREPSNDDEAVIRRVLDGDVDAFETLVDRYTGHVLRVVARNVPRARGAEVAHEVFVAAYVSLAGYAATHPFEHWLTRIALRCCSDFWRREYRERDRSGEALPEDELPPAEAGEPLDDRELLEWALGGLELEDRQVLTLVYFEGLSVKESAQLLEWTESKVKVRAHRARGRLRERIERALPEARKRP